uniref:Coronin n=1 Tax=Pelusios castaneus TaxID=367368 RepID=A0A8C8SSG2_9SAUR
MNRFKASRFRHVAAKPARKETWIRDVRASSVTSCGNHIKSSCRLIAFNADSAGVLGIVPVESQDGGKRPVTQLCCHSDVVTDLDFSPFDPLLLATSSADRTVKVWHLPESGQDLPSCPGVTLGPEGCQVDALQFHPTAAGVLVSGAGRVAKIWDVAQQKALTALDPHGDLIQSVAWKQDGAFLGTSCKDKKLRIFDPRTKPSAVQSIQGHENNKDSRLLWMNASDYILSVGFSQVREREVKLWDTRKFSSSLISFVLDTSSGAFIPLFDPDTSLLVVAGKVSARWELHLCSPLVTQCLTEGKSKGAALVPKLALDVMSCEVLRVLQLTDGFIVPISYTVPRKSQQEFHEDLFPDSSGPVPASSAQGWWAGDNKQVCAWLLAWPRETLSTSTESSSLSSPPSSLSSPSSSAPSLSASSPSQKSLQSILGPSSKFRHTLGTLLPRSTHITNLKGLNLTTPGESDGFCANQHRVAIPLLSAGGQVAILELSKPGRLPDTAVPTIENGTPIADLCWDPFDPQRLAIAGEDAKIRLWRIPPGGLQETLLEPNAVLRGHTEKIYSIRFHPLAADILTSSSYDMSVRIWDLQAGREALCLRGHRDQIFSLAWSPDGRKLATVSKDGRVRIYTPRRSPEPEQEGPGPEGGRGARLVWVCGGHHLLVSGFDSRSERQLYLYDAAALTAGPLSVLSLDVAPSTLIPFYDQDTSVVFLTGKGDTRVFVYELIPEAPFFLECNSFMSSDPHKGFLFLPKTECDVREVEFARAVRLRQSSIEPVAFRVPRIKKEFFQDDIYPPTAVCWEPALPATAWLVGSDGQHRKLSLQPKDMTPVSAAPQDVPLRKFVPASHYLEEKSDEQKKEELLSAMVAKLGNRDDPLPQDSFEGVDEAEWVGLRRG